MAPATIALIFALAAQAPAPARRAEDAVRAKDYDRAIALFREAVRGEPGNVQRRLELAYTLLKAGETESAREEFAAVMRRAPSNSQAALEYGYLSHETGHTAEARRTFDRLRKSAAGEARESAEEAFRSIDGPLAAEIARWSAVVAQSPENFNAHRELAQLAEDRDELETAAAHYLAAWRLRPAERGLRIDLGRVLKAVGRPQGANAAWLAASRGSRPRVAEEARELLPRRTPYVNEFRKALELDPGNVELRRELAYLLLEMGRKDEAEKEFERISRAAPKDLVAAAQLGFLRLERKDAAGALPLLETVLGGGDDELAARVRSALGLPADFRVRPLQVADGAEAKEMGDRSYRAGFLQDALKYYSAAHQADPTDFAILLRLGWTYNMLHRDDAAARWFDLARRSPDPRIAAEAARAYRSLRPAFARFRTTVWAFPLFSSRWRDVFSYGQVKTEMRIGGIPARPYLSMRFVGDARRVTGEALPQYLSESSAILAAGLAMRSWRGLSAWAEAGTAVSYLNRNDRGRMVPDYRAGLAWGRAAGRLLGGEGGGWFAETANDGVFISRFQNDFLIYSQNRFGYTLPPLSGLRLQVCGNANVTTDAKQQYWANSAEAGPGVRFRWDALPQSMVLSAGLLRGAYTRNEGNPRRPNYIDVRAGVWYAATR